MKLITYKFNHTTTTDVTSDQLIPLLCFAICKLVAVTIEQGGDLTHTLTARILRGNKTK